jgi:hypothetical protein
MGFGIVRPELDGLAERGDGVVQLVLGRQGKAEVVMGSGDFGVEVDGLAERGNGVVAERYGGSAPSLRCRCLS